MNGGQDFRGGNFKHLKFPWDVQGIRRFATVTQISKCQTEVGQGHFTKCLLLLCLLLLNTYTSYVKGLLNRHFTVTNNLNSFRSLGKSLSISTRSGSRYCDVNLNHPIPVFSDLETSILIPFFANTLNMKVQHGFRICYD